MNVFYRSRVLRWANTTYAKTSTGYHEIKLYNIIKANFSFEVKSCFMENCERFLHDYEIFKLRLILTTLDYLNDNRQQTHCSSYCHHKNRWKNLDEHLLKIKLF